MSLMRRLLGKSPEPDPQKYTRVGCEACEGTGWLMSGGEMYLIEGMPSVCSSCDGTGWLRETRDANALPDTPEQHPSAAQAAQQIAGESPREVLASNNSNSDALVAPTPPRGLLPGVST